MTTKIRDTPTSLPSIGSVVLRVAMAIAPLELMIMLFLKTFERDIPPNLSAVIDTVALILLSSPIIYLWIVRPFAQAHAEALKKIHHMAYHDELTSLPNRRQLVSVITESLAASLRHQESVALLFIDLDGFKAINDTYGHEAGDLVLKTTAERLRTHVRMEDAVSRIGGDEFVVLISRLSPIDSETLVAAQTIAQKMADDVCTPILSETQTFNVSASIGVRISCGSLTDADTLLSEADEAMYMAKRDGRAKIWIRGTNDAAPHAVSEHNTAPAAPLSA